MEDLLVESLIRDLLQWVTRPQRTYEEVMEAWRTSCPKLPVWEEACDRGFIRKEAQNGEYIVSLSREGVAFLERSQH
ncbi:MAG: hypothetical protein C5B58_03825 [Acidobacteria bacterium]|nr:MAG: hypothetical protein C5B58_03825 [Acidobacteriota bacterium]